MIWLGVTLWALMEARHRRPGTRALIVVAAAIFGMLMTYAVLGGDHFVLWRFYQPVAPLIPIALALLVAMGAGKNFEWSTGGANCGRGGCGRHRVHWVGSILPISF